MRFTPHWESRFSRKSPTVCAIVTSASEWEDRCKSRTGTRKPLGARLLRVRTARARDADDRLAGRGAALRHRDVAERDDADEALVAVHHRQPAHAQLGHVGGDMPEVLVVV